VKRWPKLKYPLKQRRPLSNNNSQSSRSTKNAPLLGPCDDKPPDWKSDRQTIIPIDDDDDEEDKKPTEPVKQKRQRFTPFVRRCSDMSVLKGMSGYAKQANSAGILAMEQRRVFLCGVLVFIVYLLVVSALFTQMTEWDFWTAFYFLFNSVALIGFGDVFPSQPRIILVNMFFIVTGVVLFSMCYFILQEEIRVKAFEASRKARMSICKYSQSLMLHTRPWSRRNSPNFDESSTGTNFDRLRKRRQSAPAIDSSIDRAAGSQRRKSSVPR